MTERDVIRIARGHFESQFPKRCPKCGREFATLKDYIDNTRPVGSVHSYDAEALDWDPKRPVGTIISARCRCGDTLSLTSAGMDPATRKALLGWLRTETARLGMSPNAILNAVRAKLRAEILAEPG